MTIIISKCDLGNVKVPVIDMDAPVIRDRFMREVKRRNSREKIGKKLKKIIFCVGLCLFLLSSTNFSTVTASPKDNDRFNGTVFFMRHALAPGNGDPKKFLIGDCRTQRNLDETGRRQAFEIGKKLKKSGLIFSAVYTSRWCRCIETADILDLGYAIPFDGLNSFYQGHFDRDVVLEKLRTKLKTISKVDNPT